MSALFLNFVEGASRDGILCIQTAQGLPTPYGDINILGIQLNPIADAARALSRDHGRTTTQEDIQHNIASSGAIHHSVCDQGDGLYGGMKFQQIALLRRPREGIYPRVTPHVGPIST